MKKVINLSNIEYRKILIENMLKILANKNLHQSRKIEFSNNWLKILI